MSLVQILFYVFATLAIGSALAIVFTKNILYAALGLLLTFLAVAALYVMAGADFLAIVQIMIYIGGVLVLMIFGVMLTSKSADRYLLSPTYNRFGGILAGVGLFVLFLLAILKVNFSSIQWIAQAQQSNGVIAHSTLSGVGVKLMTDFVLPFEVAGILLMAALLGAAYIAGRK